MAVAKSWPEDELRSLAAHCFEHFFGLQSSVPSPLSLARLPASTKFSYEPNDKFLLKFNELGFRSVGLSHYWKEIPESVARDFPVSQSMILL
jgi:hypothetical protein